jgi:xanthine dehydrogenase YagS FAD-binding subunit
MRPFAYTRAVGANDAVLDRSADAAGSRFLAGGTTLLDLAKLDVERPSLVVDINRLPLATIATEADGTVRIGALARMTQTADDATIRAAAPALAIALAASASAQLRNMASIGGNIMQRTRCMYFRDLSQPCNKRSNGEGCSAIGGDDRHMAILGATPSCIAVHPSDFSTALLLTDATLHVQGPHGSREIPFRGFNRLPGDDPTHDTTLGEGELITGISFLPNAATRNSTYVKVRDRASYEFALVSAAAGLEVVDGVIRTARIALGSVAHAPWRATLAEAALVGKAPTAENYRAAAAAELAPAKPLRLNGFKIRMAQAAMVRALTTVGGKA